MGQLQTTTPSNALQSWGSRNSGRAIFANGNHRQLLDNFRQLSAQQSSEGFHAQSLIKAVDSLRGPASPVNSMLKPNHPTRRLLVAGGFEIEYELNSYYGDCQTDVEIVEIRLLGGDAREERRPALWAIKHRSGDQWTKSSGEPKLKLEPTGKLSGTKESPLVVGINGHSHDLQHAASTLALRIPRGDQNKRTRLEDTGFDLLYVPAETSALVNEWVSIKSLGLRGTDEQRRASRVLAQHMYEAHRQKLHVEWTAHKHGAWVLTEAMQQLARQNVNLEERQKVFLCDASASHVVADRARHLINMDTNDLTWKNTSPGPAQITGGLHFGIAPLLCLADELRHRTSKDEILGKGGDLVWQTTTKGVAISGAATALVSTAGISASLALLGVGVLIASLPGARDTHYKNPGQQLGDWLNRFRKRD